MSSRFLIGLVLSLWASFIPAAIRAQAPDEPSVLRVVATSELLVIDPLWTSAHVTRNHGYMVYDTLFSPDANGIMQPQMVDRWNVDATGLLWSFTLRDGLFFHNGDPVTARDVVASLKRWGHRDSFGRQLFHAMRDISATSEKTFELAFNHPFPMTIEALGKSSSVPAFIMPERVAATPSGRQITDATGSGPFIFVPQEFKRGQKAVYVKNTAYNPRPEPSSGMAGGKQVYFDRVEFVFLHDSKVQAEAMKRGDIDIILWAAPKAVELLKNDPDVKIFRQTESAKALLHLNHLVPPFDNVLIARAALMAIDQKAILGESSCPSIYPCNSLYAGGSSSYYKTDGQFEEARALLKKAGYDGTPIVLMRPVDTDLLNDYPLIMGGLLEKAGFKVQIENMSWNALISKRTIKAPIAQGGWNAFISLFLYDDVVNPLYFAPMTGTGAEGWFGWAVDERLEALKAQFASAETPEKKREIAEELQVQVINSAIYGPIGDVAPIAVYRIDVAGLPPASVPILWNIRRKQAAP